MLALMTAMSYGCTTISESGCTRGDTPVGFVTSSGRYCVARSIAIHAEGLSLGNAVQQVLRVPHRSVIGNGITPVMQTTTKRLPPEASTIALDLGAKAAEHFEVSGDVNDARAHGVKVNVSNLITQEQWRVLEPEIRRCFERALANGMLAGPASDALDGLPVSDPDMIRQKAVRSRLAMELEATLVFGLLWQDSSTPAPGEDTIPTTVDFIIATQTPNFGKQTPFAQSQQMDAVRAEVGAVEQIIVTLVQHNGRILSAPLWLVTNYSAGDILLAPNDHIEVNAFSQSSIGSPVLQSAEGNILSLGSMADPEVFSIEAISGKHGSFEEFARIKGNGIADVVVIRRIELSGQLHDFILPIPQPEVYACAGAASEMMNEVRLQPGDQIHLEVLDLTPMIRESRRISQVASRAAIEEAARLEGEARQSWVAKKFRKHHEKKQMGCARISSQTELITGMQPQRIAVCRYGCGF